LLAVLAAIAELHHRHHQLSALARSAALADEEDLAHVAPLPMAVSSFPTLLTTRRFERSRASVAAAYPSAPLRGRALFVLAPLRQLALAELPAAAPPAVPAELVELWKQPRPAKEPAAKEAAPRTPAQIRVTELQDALAIDSLFGPPSRWGTSAWSALVPASATALGSWLQPVIRACQAELVHVRCAPIIPQAATHDSSLGVTALLYDGLLRSILLGEDAARAAGQRALTAPPCPGLDVRQWSRDHLGVAPPGISPPASMGLAFSTSFRVAPRAHHDPAPASVSSCATCVRPSPLLRRPAVRRRAVRNVHAPAVPGGLRPHAAFRVSPRSGLYLRER
jgi:hypothetical protein